MRSRKERLIITFPTTVSAMTMEERAKELGLPGRIIPVPTSITASCGLAWMTEPEQREEAERFLEEQNLVYDRICTVCL